MRTFLGTIFLSMMLTGCANCCKKSGSHEHGAKAAHGKQCKKDKSCCKSGTCKKAVKAE